jgi:hypothetical protein
MSAHGFVGRESETVEAIVNWMLKRPYATEISESPPVDTTRGRAAAIGRP